MTASNTTDRTYLVDVRALSAGFKTYEVEAENVYMAQVYAESMAAKETGVSTGRAYAASVRLKPLPERACVICGTPESSTHTSASPCCWNPDNIEEV